MWFWKRLTGRKSGKKDAELPSAAKHASAADTGSKEKTAQEPEGTFYDVVVVGGGNSAGYFCKELKALGFDGKVAVISKESVAPYERPALTKAFLHAPGSKVRARLPGFHTCVGSGGERQLDSWYADHNIDLFFSTECTGVDLESKTVETSSGAFLSFDKLVLATGARPLTPQDIRLPGAELQNVFTIREEKEAMELVQALESPHVKDVVVVGGGYIGMEVAAALSGWGFQVTLVIATDHLLDRFFPAQVAAVFEHKLEAHGVTLRKGAKVTGLEASSSDSGGGRVNKVLVDDVDSLDADVVVFGIGSKLNMELVKETSLKMARVGGLAVDDTFMTSCDSVYAIGDLAALNGQARYEHVDFCRKSAARAAASIAQPQKEDGTEFNYLPYFYSRLFEFTETPLVFQFYGDAAQGDSKAVELFGSVTEASQTPSSESVPTFGVMWIEEQTSKVTGVLLCNASSPEQYNRAKEIALNAPEFTQDLCQSLLD